ncbi:hypothetical protein FGO68_gene14459 [Halteria grandinella]|uniref:Uncharacterized protein n=1 Tax=Halteria grandinella TaxID=5974 RepID=A0A8J8NVI4_HALGN|nr:hypothetical protein FGO68_gene14459 [Halteria grandinella]
MNFNDPPGSVTAMMLKAERDLAAQALPLSTIKESATSRFSNSQAQQMHPAYQQYSNNGLRGQPNAKPMSQSNGASSRFKGGSISGAGEGIMFPPTNVGSRGGVGGTAARTRKSGGSKQISPRRSERTLEHAEPSNQTFSYPPPQQRDQNKLSKLGEISPAGSRHRLPQTPTTINNNNIVININKNYNAAMIAGSKLKQVQEETFEDGGHPGEDGRTNSTSSVNQLHHHNTDRRSKMSRKQPNYGDQGLITPQKRGQASMGGGKQQVYMSGGAIQQLRISDQAKNKYLNGFNPQSGIPQGMRIAGGQTGRFALKKISQRKLRSLSPREALLESSYASPGLGGPPTHGNQRVAFYQNNPIAMNDSLDNSVSNMGYNNDDVSGNPFSQTHTGKFSFTGGNVNQSLNSGRDGQTAAMSKTNNGFNYSSHIAANGGAVPNGMQQTNFKANPYQKKFVRIQ